MNNFYERNSALSDDSHNPMKQARFTGIPTFMRTPLVTDLSDLDIALVGIPYDGAVTNRPGARHGPQAIRAASTLMPALMICVASAT